MYTARDLREARGVAPEASEWSQMPGIDVGMKFENLIFLNKNHVFFHFLMDFGRRAAQGPWIGRLPPVRNGAGPGCPGSPGRPPVDPPRLGACQATSLVRRERSGRSRVWGPADRSQGRQTQIYVFFTKSYMKQHQPRISKHDPNKHPKLINIQINMIQTKR